MIVDEWSGGCSTVQFEYRVRWTGDDYALESRVKGLRDAAFVPVTGGAGHYAAYRFMQHMIPEYEAQRISVRRLQARRS